ncbi:hypothetical protein Ahy_B06g084637 [Arachis hypogaea]|uniref:Uncharacterized protein n=1 Tax=Arachis hypogaea TaxID=3818 RepID=A0A444YSD4_ARAHY|nr:hypothetical protein Ahy_B06g084637 [Arachis hypogaea]
MVKKILRFPHSPTSLEASHSVTLNPWHRQQTLSAREKGAACGRKSHRRSPSETSPAASWSSSCWSNLVRGCHSSPPSLSAWPSWLRCLPPSLPLRLASSVSATTVSVVVLVGESSAGCALFLPKLCSCQSSDRAVTSPRQWPASSMIDKGCCIWLYTTSTCHGPCSACPCPAPAPAAPAAPIPAPAAPIPALAAPAASVPAPAAPAAPADPAPALAAHAAPAPAPAASVPAPADTTSAPPTAPVDRRIGKRGPSRGIATNRVIKTKTNGKLELPISLENLVPNGIHADLFASEVGIVTRQNAPLDVEKWSQVGDDVKQKICDIVLKLFLLTNFDKSFVGKEKSLRNKDNRKHHVVPHIVGRRTFQVVRRDRRHPRTGVEPDIQELWQITHQKSNGEWVNEKAKQIDDDISTMLDDSYDLENSLTPNEAFLIVRGDKSGASYGIKASKSKLRIQAQLQEEIQDREELTKEIDVLKEKLEEQRTRQEEELAQMKAQLEAQQAVVNSLIVRFDNETN